MFHSFKMSLALFIFKLFEVVDIFYINYYGDIQSLVGAAQGFAATSEDVCKKFILANKCFTYIPDFTYRIHGHKPLTKPYNS